MHDTVYQLPQVKVLFTSHLLFILFKLIPLLWVRNNIMWTIFAIHHYHEWKLFSQTVVKSNNSSLFLTYWSFSFEFPRYKTDKPRSTMDWLSTLPQPNRNAFRVAAKLKIKPNLEPPASWQSYRGHYQDTLETFKNS